MDENSCSAVLDRLDVTLHDAVLKLTVRCRQLLFDSILKEPLDEVLVLGEL